MDRGRVLLRANAPCYRRRSRSASRSSKAKVRGAQAYAQLNASDIAGAWAYEVAGPTEREKKKAMRAANSRIRAITPPPSVPGRAYGSKLWRGAAAKELSEAKTVYNACPEASGDGLLPWEATLFHGRCWSSPNALAASDVLMVGKQQVLLPGQDQAFWLFSPYQDHFACWCRHYNDMIQRRFNRRSRDRKRRKARDEKAIALECWRT